ncbi:arylamine N-acetyltransferase [Actinokineospora sp. NBRC 105648]|uniref:arylamine N-acetyltransferase family protein n=1 Tax=Actinokineospora sp. NBRC 105648 TaxID=3032206 RepID=UPI0024A0EF63|nr:arylamine N-acetyltransferase [Actinokineospora sp. NBRC 105648]GLZ38177.1 arylamine N-acetyltransferase [Actinokineospora sp. NBRC 105648]
MAERTWRRPLDHGLRDAYLARLGHTSPPPPTVQALLDLHRAQVERVPYEVVWIALGEQRGVDPLESVGHLVNGRGGYCYHLNGAFACLLDWLGFDVHWRVGGVQTSSDDEPVGATANHLALEVHGLPAAESPDGRWFVDTGLGDALHEPLPLRPGSYPQDPSVFTLRPSPVIPGGWRFDHDPRGGFHGMDFTPSEATVADFADRHRELSTGPDSAFVRVVTLALRGRGSITTLRSLRLTRRGTPDGQTGQSSQADQADRADLATKADYFAALQDVFRLRLSDVDDQRRDALWHRVRADHEEFLSRAQ